MRKPRCGTRRPRGRHWGRVMIPLVIAGASFARFAQADYVESYQTWSATSADTWQVQDLSGAPYNVPANAVVEVAVRNSRTNFEYWGGVRAVGSSLDRRFQLHEPEGGGQDFVVMHVQANANSQIEHYANVTGNVTFVLLGYWDCGTYVETFDTFSAGASTSWQNHNLSTYGVGAGEVAEIVLVNNNAGAEREAGVRANGSGLSRIVDIHEAEGDGDDLATMFVEADGTANATIEVYAEADADVDFVLVGYWSTPPGMYTELASDVGSPSTDATWEDLDLSGSGVPAGAVAEFALANREATGPTNMGVRENGSTLARFLDLQEAEDGGSDLGRLHVTADGSATVEFYHEYVGDAHTFLLSGYWETTALTLSNHSAEQETDAFTESGGETDAELFAFKLEPAGVAITITEIVFSLSSISGLVDGDWAGVEIVVDADDSGDIDSGESTTVGGAGTVNQGAGTITFTTDFDLTAATSYILRADFASLSDGDAVTIDLTTANITTAVCHKSGSTTSVTHQEGSFLTLADHSAGQETDAFSEYGGETDAELFAFELSPNATITVTQLVFSLSGISGLTDGDWAGVEIVVDTSADGDIGEGESTTVGGSGTVNQAAGTITFSTNFDVTAITRYILRADFASLSGGDAVTIDLTAGNIITTASTSGSATSVIHHEQAQCYYQRFQTWTASSAGTWQTQDLSGAPYNVPADAIVEVAVTSTSAFAERWGGVRAVGSSLDRRFQLHEAEDGGADVVILHVQADGSSQIEHYAEVTTDVDFALLGCWVCGTYVEAFDTFTAGASASWQDRDLCPFGVVPAGVAEIVMTNDRTSTEYEAGVRTNGSSLQRRLDLHEAEGSGVDAATMFVKADASAGATVELYAENDSYVDFYLVGYWSTAPLAYTELFADVGNPTTDATWEDLDLTADGVPDNAVAEFALANDFATEENAMGIRANASSVARLLDLQEPEDGGSDLGRMHVQTDGTAAIEFYHEDVSDTHTFRLVGYWDSCDTTISYMVTDLGALLAEDSSLGFSLTPTGGVAGFDEDADGDGSAWFADCGALTSLGTLGGSNSEALAVNDFDEVVGWAHDASGNRRAFIWDSVGGMTNLGTISGRTDSEALGVNGNSEVVGAVLDFGAPSTKQLAFLYLPSPAYSLPAGMNNLGTLGGFESIATAINDSGQVVGGALNAGSYMRPFRWQNGTMADLGTLGGESGSPLHRGHAINSSGDVVGMSYTAGGDGHAFLWDGSMTDLGVLTGGDTSWALGINDHDQVVGTANVTGGDFHAFIWEDGAMTDLNDEIDAALGWELTRAIDITDDGQIVGWGTNGSGDLRAFLLTPTCSNAGGGAAAFSTLLARGLGVTDFNGQLEQTAVTEDGELLAEIVVYQGDAGETFSYTVTEPDVESTGAPGPDPGTWAGFTDGVGLGRTLTVETSASVGSFISTISMGFSAEELAAENLEPAQLELYVLDQSQGELPGVWMPAGTHIGESATTGVLGHSGFFMYADDSVDYWAVRDAPGIYAVGARSENDDDKPDPGDENNDNSDPSPPERPAPTMCGLGMIQAGLVTFFSLVTACGRRRRR